MKNNRGPNERDKQASQSQCPTDSGLNRAARWGCGLNRFHAPCRSSLSFSCPTHTVCDLGALPVCGPPIRNYCFQGLVRPYRAMLYGVVLVLTVTSLAIYVDVALGPPRTKTAFVFVVVPPASWLLIAITISIGALNSRRRSARSSDS